jgi:hypothetical protein
MTKGRLTKLDRKNEAIKLFYSGLPYARFRSIRPLLASVKALAIAPGLYGFPFFRIPSSRRVALTKRKYGPPTSL